MNYTKERREEEKEKRIQQIISAARELFAKFGVKNTSISKIGKKCRLSRGLIYFYFKDRDHIYLTIVNLSLQFLLAAMKNEIESHATGIERVEAIGMAYIKFTSDNPDYFHALSHFQSEIDDDLSQDKEVVAVLQSILIKADKINRLIESEIVQGQNDGTIKKNLDPLKTALSIWSMTSGLIQTANSKGTMFKTAYGLDKQKLIEQGMQLLRLALRG
jgi:AcrR family transcriptional regulator